MRLALRNRILLLVIGTVASLLTVVLVYMTTVAGEQIKQAVQDKVRSASFLLSRVLNDRSTALGDRSKVIVPDLTALGRGAGFSRISRFAKNAKKEIRADLIMITSGTGQLLGDSSYVKPNGTVRRPKKLDMSVRRHIAASIKRKEWKGVVTRGKGLFIATTIPILTPDKRKVAFTVTAYERIDFDLAEQMRRSLLTNVAFVNGGKLVVSSLGQGLVFPENGDLKAELHLNKEDYLAAYTRLPGSAPSERMGFMILERSELAMSPYRNVYATVLLAAAVALAIALIAGLALGRSFGKPLEQVIEAARLIQKGEWPEPLLAKRTDEIGLLQTVFNSMTLALRESQEKLLSLIDADPLTGLDNHRKFQERLEQEAVRTSFSKEDLSLVLLDIDKFQEYNLAHGHAAGDSALAKIAKVVEKHCPTNGAASRYGGEEFALLLPKYDLERAEELAEGIRAEIEKLFSPKGTILTLSAGCAQLGTHSQQFKGLVLTAELAVARAKQLGRNRVCRFDMVPGADSDADPFQLHRFLQDGSFATIQALAAAVDAKDPYTQGHSQRVAEYGRDLAQFVGLPSEIVNLTFTSGTLHDVGKVGVPDEILKKPGALTPEERAVMETHPVLGELIVKKAPHLADSLPGVRHHHERWDGKGYPDKLAGEEIPLLGRILAVADMFDAMTSDRPYRKGLAFWEAVWEIERQAGKQLDPTLAGAFVSMMQERNEWHKLLSR